MATFITRAVLSAAFVAGFAAVPVPLRAQQTSKVAAAPVPAQILTAKKVFVSHAMADTPRAKYSGDPDRTYNQFYAAMKGWGHFEFVAAPVDADLICEISFANPIVSVEVTDGAIISGQSTSDPQLILVLLDPKTHLVLWTLTEHVASAKTQEYRDKNFDLAVAAIVDDAKKLVAQTATGSAGAGN